MASLEEITSLLREQEARLRSEFDKKLAAIEKKNEKENEYFKNENKKLNDKANLLEKDLRIAFEELEKNQSICHSTDQYQRRNNIELSGIPKDLDGKILEDVVIDLVNNLIKEPGQPTEDDSNNIGPGDIEACHRIMTKNKDGVNNTIVRFTNRKICDEIHSSKNRMNKIKVEELGNSVSQIYVNENLSNYFKQLSAKCRRLKKKKLIIDTWVFKGMVKVQMVDETIHTISHQNVLDRFFPGVVYFN